MNREIQVLTPWGNFEPSDIKYLKEKGIDISLFSSSPDTLKKLPESDKRFVLSQTKTQVLFSEIGLGDAAELEIEPFPLPERSLAAAEKEMALKEERINEVDWS